jgi:hypothetical protein
MARGRPIKSQIRQNIIEILYFMKQGYGYDIFKVYKSIFPAVTMRVIYYHLKKGTDLGEFRVHEVKREKGEYSWGSSVEKIYYALGENAKPSFDSRVKDFFDNRG